MFLISCYTTVLANQDKSVEFLNSAQILPEGLPFSEAVLVGDVLYLSGQLGNIPGTLNLIEGGIKAESVQVMDNIKSILKTHGLEMKNLIKCTVMLADIDEWSSFNAVYQTYFSKPYPARSAFATNGLALGARVEVECMAVVSL